ncbi:DNA repair protein RecO [Planctobacterium marinum]|uniref:DNA repair protein RecO n=1 Tax=Planctobacterium marinum TaxID=1631968 RepID=UPI001E5E107F|nr:DNA repair protein RecO [Planctobacterium marinum]MCC2605250.1 DNA repair protein RecO [Planctobacterium marinum]
MAEFMVEHYVLHATPYKETSALVTGFSLELGKIRYVAKGVYGKSNKFKGLTQAFTLFSTRLSGNGELKSGYASEALHKPVALQGTALYCALYCNEVLVRLLPHEEPFETGFHFYQHTLQRLAKEPQAEPVLREFELFLLQELGSAYDFFYDALSNDPIAPEKSYDFVLEQGFCLASATSKQAFLGEHILAIGQQNWSPQALKVAKYFTRLALSPYLGNKPLKSRELFQKPL